MADTTILDTVKRDVGDSNNDYFTDDEYRSFIYRHFIDEAKTDADAFRVETTDLFRITHNPPVYNLTIVNTSGNAFDVDSYAGVVDNTDGNEARDELKVSYVRIDYGDIISEILTSIATNKSKLAIAQRSSAFDMDLRELRNELMEQAIIWENRCFD